MHKRALITVLLILLGTANYIPAPAQSPSQVSPTLFSELRWRAIGPHRASRTRAAAGHPSQPFTFYMAR